MKKIALTFSTIVLLMLVGNAQERYTVNTVISSLEWIGKKVTGQHQGVIDLKKGSYLFENGLITSGELIINMQSIKITDIEDKEQNDKLKNHLVSSDFFSVEKQPTAQLTIVKSQKIDETRLKVTADLTIKGITKRIEFEVTLLIEGKKMVAIGEVDIDRTQFDIRYGSGSFIDNLGDKAIKDPFTIKFKIAALTK